MPEEKEKPVGFFKRVDNFVRAGANGATFGYADYAAGYMNSWFNGKTVNDSIREEQALSAKANEETPGESIAGNVVGSILTVELALGKLAKLSTVQKMLPAWATGRPARFGVGLGAGTLLSAPAMAETSQPPTTDSHTLHAGRVNNPMPQRQNTDKPRAVPEGEVAAPTAGTGTAAKGPDADKGSDAGRHPYPPSIARLVQKALARSGELPADMLGHTGKQHDGIDGDWRVKSQQALELFCRKHSIDCAKVDLSKASNPETQKLFDQLHLEPTKHGLKLQPASRGSQQL